MGGGPSRGFRLRGRCQLPSQTAEDCPTMSNFLASNAPIGIFRLPFGAVAQLGERRTGSAEVWGSIPHSSTKDCLFVMLARRAHAEEAPARPSLLVRLSWKAKPRSRLLGAHSAVELPRTHCLFQHIVETLAGWTGRTRTIADQ